MSTFRLTRKVNLGDIELLAKQPRAQFVYGVASCWWSLWSDDPRYMPYQSKAGGLPCDPRSGLLMQGDAQKFLASARENQTHYGKHLLEAFVAAFQGNVEVFTRDGKWLPTCFTSWDDYNQLLDSRTGEVLL